MAGGGAFQPFLPDVGAVQGWVGSVSSGHDVPGLRVAQEALLTPVCDTGYSSVLRGRLLQGTQPFERGLGYSHLEVGLHVWDREPRRGQVRVVAPTSRRFLRPEGKRFPPSLRLISVVFLLAMSHLSDQPLELIILMMSQTPIRTMCCAAQHMEDVRHVRRLLA